uniref:NADH-ubiquinone oxidoreductase chain 5 n=1 Tax=Macrophomina phaseolina TaxID=35725 RepID=A0A8A9WEB8_9PEZI|nr:NADH dehydrogenase subunit 5 [Macrophomina phaseolina]QTT58149.1 NADH dehydrogenase subunit 5 [Macrophomina phaseolina]
MYLAIIVLPLLGSIVSGFFGRKVGVSGAQLITCSCVLTTTILAILAFFEVGLNNIPVSIQLFRWIDSESLNISWGFHFDSLTVSMLIPVLIVSSLVHVYSIGYMSHDPHNQRFFSYLSLFTFMMVTLVTANNYLLMFVGWEGVGVCSYLLVCFWFTRIAANQSSLSAFLTNRVGDCFLTIGIFTILWSFGNIDYATVFSLAPYMSENIVTIIGICLLIGAMAKSSQVGLHVWLPMAMEGPTPVSALIHAATMVTAGVYLLMRSSPLIEYSSTVLLLCLWLGAITTVFSSLIGLFQQDIKKVIAYSTMSQLGMMVIAVGLSSYNIALFHLVNHAFYKALLFLGAGSVIHSVADNQDFRKYGGLISFLPLTYSVMLIASLSLVAFPFMTGFYSKDFILESAYGQFYFSGTVVYFIATIGAMFTTLYSVKVLYLTFLTNPNGPLASYKGAHEGDIFMSLPLIILAVFSIFFGYVTKDIFIGLGSGFFSDNGIFIHPSHEILLDTEFAVPTFFKLLPFVFTLTLSCLAIVLSEFLPKALIEFKLSRLGYNIFGFFNQRFLIEMFYNKYITNTILKIGGQTTKFIDKGSVELIGPYGLEKGLLNLSNNIASLDTGVITSYALYILVGLIFYIIIPYISLFDNSLILIIIYGLLSVKHIKKQYDYRSNIKSILCNT